MSKIGRRTCLAAASLPAAESAVVVRDEASTRRPSPSSPLSGLGPAFGANGSKFTRTQPARVELRSSAGRLKVGRKPGTKQRLGRLRRELGRIGVAPADPHHARSEIVEAMARAGLDGWTVPELDDGHAVRYPDGSLEITLITHAVVFNPGGAFRIVDLYPPTSIYFEMAGQDGREFVPPAGRTGKRPRLSA
jgi:hypothetical protein